MAQKIYIVDGRQFRTELDYKKAVHDKEVIDRLRKGLSESSPQKKDQMMQSILEGKYQFYTLLGQDFQDEIREQRVSLQAKNSAKSKRANVGGRKTTQIKSGSKNKNTGPTKKQGQAEKSKDDAAINAIVQRELKKREKRRKLFLALCSILAIGCLGYFGLYSYYEYRTGANTDALTALKEKEPISVDSSYVIHYTNDENVEPREVLDEYKNLLNRNKKLIGWVKIDDTNIDYPVMQTGDNEYYLDHNLNQEYDKNGSIFMDKDCDVLKPSTNFILYGHHMKNGKMFGDLDDYSSESFWEKHPYVQFDTIYEKGIYQIMYVFRSRVYSEEEIVFKYYQFIDAVSEQEFDSNMDEMSKLSLYDTGVTAQYGDQLLTLSTCDYQEKNGRFVVVAKKVPVKE